MWGPTLQRKSLCAKESRFPPLLSSHWSRPNAKQQAASPVGLDGGGGSYLSRGSLLSLPHSPCRHRHLWPNFIGLVEVTFLQIN